MAYLGQRTFASFEKKSSGWGEDFDEDQELYSDGNFDFDSNTHQLEKEEENDKPQKEKGEHFPILPQRNIPKGDPEHYAMRLFVAKLLNLENDDYRVERVISHFTWEKTFPYSSAGVERNIFLTNSVFITALEIAYQQEGLTPLNAFTKFLREKEDPFSKEQREVITSLVISYSKLTDVDVIYFNKWITKKHSKENGVKIGEVELDSLETHKNLLDKFLANKLVKMSEEGTLKDFTTHTSAQRSIKLENLIDRINLIPSSLITEFVDETGYGFWQTAYSLITGINPADSFSPIRKVAEDKLKRFNEIDKKFQEKGFSIAEIYQFRNLFQEIAIGEAFSMLKENHKILVSELVRYDNWDNFMELYNYLEINYTPKFRKADELRADAAVKFLSRMNSYHPNLSEWNPITSKIVKLRNKKKKLVEYIAQITPRELMSALAHILNIKEWLDKPIDKAKEQLTDFKLMVIGDHKLVDLISNVYNSDPKFRIADKKDMETIKMISSEGSEHFPVLADISFDFRRLTTYKPKDLHNEILKELATKKKNNEYIQKELASNPEIVWKLELLIEKVCNDYGISDDNSAGIIINDVLKDIAKGQLWKNIGLGALGIVLGIAGFFTGGLTWGGLVLLGGSVAVSAYGLYESYQDYTFDDSAKDTALFAANELSAKEPSTLGIVLGVLGLVLDLGALAKGIKALSSIKTSKGGTLISKESDLIDATGHIKGTAYKPEELRQVQQGFDELTTAIKQKRSIKESAEKIYEVLRKGRLKGNPTLEEFTESLQKIVSENKALDKEIITAIKAAKINVEIATEITEGILSIGLKRIFAKDPEAAKRLLMSFGDNPKVLYQMLNESLHSDRFAGTFSNLNKLLSDTANFEKVVIYLSNVRRTGLSSIDDLVIHIEKAGVKIPELAAEIIISPQLQKTFRNMKSPEEIIDLWKAFTIKPRRSSFTEYAKSTAKYKTTKKINSKYPDFDSMIPRDKNLTLLGDTEGVLMDAIKNNKLLPDNKQLKNALDDLLNKDLIGGITQLDAARGKVISEINKIIGKNIKNVDELKQVMQLVNQPASRGSIGEHFAVAKKLLGTSESNIVTSISIDVKDLGLKNPQKFHPDELIFNKQNGKFGEVKTGYSSGGIDIDQVDNYVTIFQNRFKLEYADMFKQLGVEPKNFKGIDYLILPGKTGDDAFKAAAETYNKIINSSIFKVEDMIEEGSLIIKYLDADNIVKVYKP